MPIVLSPILSERMPGLWGEGQPFSKSVIYDINSTDPSRPPVHYNSYALKPHSLPHVDAPGHIIPGGCDIDWFYKNNHLAGFYGRVAVVKLKGDNFKAVPGLVGAFHWEVGREEFVAGLSDIGLETWPARLFLTVENCPLLPVDERELSAIHNPDYALTLAPEVAKELLATKRFKAFGTSWKSTDFQPGKRDRPIHKIFLSQKITIFECLDLRGVMAGEYLLFAFPLPMSGATESPVVPVLFTFDELNEILLA